MSKINIFLLIVLILSFGKYRYDVFQKNQNLQEELNIVELRKPLCFNSGIYKVLRFYNNGIYHLFYINRTNIDMYIKAQENSSIVEYFDLYPETKTKCPKVFTINFYVYNILKQEKNLDNLYNIFKLLEMN